MLLFAFSCVEQEKQDFSPATFFNYGGDDAYMRHIVSQLKLKNDTTAFTGGFVQQYGTPLWDESSHFRIEERLVYGVPVKRNYISSIWFFDMDKDYTKYFVFTRNDAGNDPGLEWMFDYFNVKLSLYRPSYPGEIKVFKQQQLPLRDTDPLSRGTITIETTRCFDLYTGTEGNLVYQETFCTTSYTYINVPGYVSRQDNGGFGGFVGGNGPGSDLPSDGGGGGPSGTGQAHPVSNAIVITNNLSAQDKDRFESAIRDMLADCSAAAIYNYLVTNKAGFTSVEIDPNLGGETGYGLSSGKLSFRDSEFIDKGAISHEMFHAFQKSQGSYKGPEYIGLMEFERALFDDIAFVVQNTVNGKIKSGAYLDKKSPFVDNGAPYLVEDNYGEWLDSITNNGTIYPKNISNTELLKYAKLFGEYSRAYGMGKYNYDLNYDFKAFNKALDIIKNNCN